MTADADAPRCFRCKSTYKVKEVAPTQFCCSGFCLRYWNGSKNEKAGGDKRLDSSVASSTGTVVEVKPVADKGGVKEAKAIEEETPSEMAPNLNGVSEGKKDDGVEFEPFR